LISSFDKIVQIFYHQEPANYEFSYEVNDPPSGQNFGHSERRQGDDTAGSYYVLLPDGRLQRVEYTAGVGGYRARVSKNSLHYLYIFEKLPQP
jgi:Insect cuticle protein